jgi:tetratricopeptide (TPR) repeat protein/CHAT domain-containing protein
VKHGGALILLLIMATVPATAADRPQPSPEGVKALKQLVQVCVEGNALEVAKDPATGISILKVRDTDKLRALLHEHRDLLTPALRDTAIAVNPKLDHSALLQAVGEETKDNKALAYAALFRGQKEEQRQHGSDALTEYQAAAGYFAKLEDQGGEALALNYAGAVLHGQAAYDKALATLQRALALLRKANPPDNGQLAGTLNNIGAVYASRGEYARALDSYQRALELRKKLDPPQPAAVADSLHNLSTLYIRRGDYRQAQDYCKQALDIRQRLGPDARLDVADSLTNLGVIEEDLGDYDAAQQHHEQALAIRRDLRGEQHPDFADSLNHLGSVAAERGQYDEAEKLFRRALAIEQAVYGKDHPAVAPSLSNLGNALHHRGKYAEALEYYQQALAIWQRVYGDRHPLVATVLDNIGGLHYDQGAFTKAREYIERALAIRRQVFGDRHPDVATSLNNLGAVYQEQGDPAAALERFQQALAIRRQVFGDRHPDVATSLMGIGRFFLDQGEFGRALERFQEARQIRKQALGDRHPDLAGTIGSIAEVYYRRGEYPEALARYHRALRIEQQALGDNHARTATTRNNLGLTYHHLGEDERALECYQQALAANQKTLGDHHPAVAANRNNIGSLHYERAEYEQAEENYRQALAIYREAYGDRHPDVAAALNNLGSVAYGERHYSQAADLFAESLAALQTGAEALPPARLRPEDLQPFPQAVLALYWRGACLEKNAGPSPTAAQLRDCLASYDLAGAVLDRLCGKVLETEESKAQLGSEHFDLFARRVALCQRLYELDGDAGHLQAALTAAEQGTAQAFLQALGRSRAESLGGVSAELREEERRLLAQQRETEAKLARQQAAPRDQRDPELVGRLLEEQKRGEGRFRQLIERMEREYPQYASLRYPHPCSPAEARACLGDNEVALVFVLGSTASAVIVLEAHPAPEDKAGGVAVYRLPPAEALSGTVTALTDTESTLPLPARVRELGAQAYAQLLAPLAGRIKGKDLVIVPGGALAYLPFELLIEGTDPQGNPQYLVQNHRIRYAPSLTVLHLVRQWQAKRDPQPDRALWALGDPVYEAADDRVAGKADVAAASKAALAEYLARLARGPAAAGLKYQRLRFSGAEVEAVRSVLGASADDVLTGLKASESAVKAASAKGVLARARYVHFATHGILGLDQGLQPSLVLNLVGNEGEDGFLQFDEVTRLKLNADLVVLSACKSVQGRLYNGEGVRGLARAFLYAGSRGVVCSLWSVEDEQTAAFMKAMYGRLKDGKPAADALRDTRLEMIRAGKAPLYWAPFVLIGE